MVQAARIPDGAVKLWSPNPGPQTSYVQGQALWGIVFGGAAGGGKTAGSLGDFLYHRQMYPGKCHGAFFRKTLVDLQFVIRAALMIYPMSGATWYEQKKMFVWPEGDTIIFKNLETWKDVLSMMSSELTRIYFEELTHWADDVPFKALRSRLRSPHGVPCGWRATCNPGGPGHNWVKDYAIDPAPAGYQPIKDGSKTFTFIPSYVTDNPYLGEDYIENLKTMGSDALVRKYLEGDWSAIEGAYFDNWRNDRHVCRPFEIPSHWLRFRSLDWGSARPFSVGWWAVASDNTSIGEGIVLPRGGLVRYREWYGAKSPNVGLKLTVEQVAEGILSREQPDENITYSVADPAMFAQDGGPSMAERMGKKKVRLQPADNARVPRGGAMGGWDMMRARLDGEEDSRPMIACFNTCVDSIRTIPALQHDEKKPEDLNSDMEDHAADEWRYACMSRPWTRPAPSDYDPVKEMQKAPTFNQIAAMHDAEQSKRKRI